MSESREIADRLERALSTDGAWEGPETRAAQMLRGAPRVGPDRVFRDALQTRVTREVAARARARARARHMRPRRPLRARQVTVLCLATVLAAGVILADTAPAPVSPVWVWIGHVVQAIQRSAAH